MRIKILCSLLVVVSMLVFLTSAEAKSPPLGFPTTCTASKPCWSWYTLSGNQRTIVPAWQTEAITVDTCAFATLDFYKLIDWSRTNHQRGDQIARAHGCDSRFYKLRRETHRSSTSTDVE